MTWVPAPARAPHRCLVTRQGTEEAGPYCDTRMDYFRPVVKDGKVSVEPRIGRLYISARGLAALCDEPGSPVQVVHREEYAAVKEHNGALLAELTAANERVAELEAELSEYRDRQGNPIDEEALATFLAEKLKPRTRARKS